MKKVMVRIAVAVDPSGDWSACGRQGSSDERSMSNAVDTLEAGEARYIVVAELDVPEGAKIVMGRVEQEETQDDEP